MRIKEILYLLLVSQIVLNVSCSKEKEIKFVNAKKQIEIPNEEQLKERVVKLLRYVAEGDSDSVVEMLDKKDCVAIDNGGDICLSYDEIKKNFRNKNSSKYNELFNTQGYVEENGEYFKTIQSIKPKPYLYLSMKDIFQEALKNNMTFILYPGKEEWLKDATWRVGVNITWDGMPNIDCLLGFSFRLIDNEWQLITLDFRRMC